MLCVISRLCVRSLGALRQPRDDNARRSTERSTRRPRTVLLTDPFCLTLNRYPSRCPCRTRRSLPLHVRVRSSPQKVLKKCIDTGSRNLVSRAPGSKADEGFLPGSSLSVRILITTKTNETPGEKEHTQSMYPLNQLKTLVSCGRDPARSLPFRRGFLLIPLILVCLGLLPAAQAAPAPETPDPGAVPGFFTTADGRFALLSLTTGQGNSAFGALSLFVDTTGNFNTGVGAGTLALNNADSNTAVGTVALLLNTTGANNTAVGSAALVNNLGEITPGDLNGSFNNAVGANALRANTTGSSNNAVGESALFFNVTGAANTAIGDVALENNDSSGLGFGNSNTAVGVGALFSNVDGDSNNAVGFNALGSNLDGVFNNYIGAFAGPGVPEDETIRIGDAFNTGCFIGGITGVVVVGDPVLVDANGQLGVGPAGSPLSMKEILKERQVVQELKATTERQAAVIALQEGQIKALTAGLKQQADQIQKVSAQLEMIRPTPRVVENR